MILECITLQYIMVGEVRNQFFGVFGTVIFAQFTSENHQSVKHLEDISGNLIKFLAYGLDFRLCAAAGSLKSMQFSCLLSVLLSFIQIKVIISGKIMSVNFVHIFFFCAAYGTERLFILVFISVILFKFEIRNKQDRRYSVILKLVMVKKLQVKKSTKRSKFVKKIVKKYVKKIVKKICQQIH